MLCLAVPVLVREIGRPEGHPLELMASHDHEGSETDPYAALLSDAMRGETFRFAREDYVEEAWRIVDPVLNDGAPIAYEPGTWGPAEAGKLVPGGWAEETQ